MYSVELGFSNETTDQFNFMAQYPYVGYIKRNPRLYPYLTMAYYPYMTTAAIYEMMQSKPPMAPYCQRAQKVKLLTITE